MDFVRFFGIFLEVDLDTAPRTTTGLWRCQVCHVISRAYLGSLGHKIHKRVCLEKESPSHPSSLIIIIFPYFSNGNLGLYHHLGTILADLMQLYDPRLAESDGVAGKR